MTAESDINIICLTETWLTADVPDGALFLNEFTLHRKDRESDNQKRKHGGVLIGVKGIAHEKIALKTKCECVAILAQQKSEKSLICCLYNPPRTSKYRWPETEFLSLLTEIEEKANKITVAQLYLPVISISNPPNG